MRRQADEDVGPDQAPYRSHGQVVLPHMHPVRSRVQCDLRTVVHHEQCVVRIAHVAETLSGVHQLVVGRVMVAQLQHVAAARQRFLEQPGGRARLDDKVEASVVQHGQ